LVEIRFDDASKSAGAGAQAEIGAPSAGSVAALGIVEAIGKPPVNLPVLMGRGNVWTTAAIRGE